MSNCDRLPRSPELLSREDSALLVVDVQERLIGAIAEHQRVVWNIARLVDGAGILGPRRQRGYDPLETGTDGDLRRRVL